MANLWLGIFFVANSVVLIVKFFYSTGLIIEYPHWFKLNIPAGILRPVLIYLYVLFLIRGLKRIELNHFLHFLPFMVIIIYQYPFLAQSADYKLQVLNLQVVNTLGVMPSWYVYFQFIYSISYLALIFIELRSYVVYNSSLSQSQRGLVNWIRWLLIGGLSFHVIAIILRIAGLTANFNYYLYEVFSIMLIILCIKILAMPEVVRSNLAQHNKYKKSSLTESEIATYFSRINQLLRERKLYKSEALKLGDLADKLGVPEYLVSQIINQKSGQSFRNYLNTFRIEEAQKMLQEPNQKFSIEGIASEVGFKSRTSFYNAFKKETGLTPSEFIQA